MLLEDVFGYQYNTTTIVLDSDSGEVIKEVAGAGNKLFAIDLLTDEQFKDCPILFKIEVAGRGTILMDLFQRPTKFN